MCENVSAVQGSIGSCHINALLVGPWVLMVSASQLRGSCVSVEALVFNGVSYCVPVESQSTLALLLKSFSVKVWTREQILAGDSKHRLLSRV